MLRVRRTSTSVMVGPSSCADSSARIFAAWRSGDSARTFLISSPAAPFAAQLANAAAAPPIPYEMNSLLFMRMILSLILTAAVAGRPPYRVQRVRQ